MIAKFALARFLFENSLVPRIPTKEAEDINSSEGLLWTLARDQRIDEESAIKLLTSKLSIRYLNLSNETSAGFDGDLCKELGNFELLWKHRMIPIKREGKEVLIAIANPFDREALQAYEFATSNKIKVGIAKESQIVAMLAQHCPQAHVSSQNSISGDEVEIIEASAEEADLDYSDHRAPPIVRLVNRIIADAIALDASDIHLEPGTSALSVRFRIDGVLQEIATIPSRLQANVIARIKVLSRMDVSEKRRPQDGRLRVKYKSKGMDLRVSTLPTSFGEKIVLRLLKSSYSTLSFEALGMPESIKTRVSNALRHKGRMFLVCGPTGAGKTTTLYVALNQLQDGKTNISTVEDPIEYRFPKINQIQVNQKTDVTFASVLRSLLRQDPDIIMVGEIRDSETIQITLQAAQTGHLVLSTVHTNDAPSAVTRMIHLGADATLLSSSLIGVLAQRLVRKTCDKCRTRLDAEDLKRYGACLARYSIDPKNLRKGRGCEACLYTGYKGRIGIFSYLEVTDAVADAIFRRASQEELITIAKSQGFTDIEEQAIHLLSSNLTTYDEVRGYIDTGVGNAIATSPITTNVTNDTANQSSTKVSRSETPSILVIDDNSTVRKMITTLLKKELLTVKEASGGIEAYNLIVSSKPTMIICDISMPDMDGIELLRRLKREKQLRDIPVIMLTADDSPDQELLLLDLGAKDFISKRTSAPIILSRIRKVLEAIQA